MEVSSAINTNVNGLFSSIIDQLMSNLGFNGDEEIEEDVAKPEVVDGSLNEESPASSEENDNVS